MSHARITTSRIGGPRNKIKCPLDQGYYEQDRAMRKDLLLCTESMTKQSISTLRMEIFLALRYHYIISKDSVAA